MLKRAGWPALGALAALAFGNAALWAPRLDKTAPAASSSSGSFDLPMACGEWAGKEAPVDARAVEILETSDVVVREYRRGDEPAVWLARVGGVGQRAAFHPPEICYVGSRFEVLDRRPVAVEVNGRRMQVMRLLIGQGRQRVAAWYWFTAGDRVTANYYRQQLWLIGDMLRQKASSGSLVRLSTAFTGEPSTGERLRAFLSEYQSCSL